MLEKLNAMSRSHDYAERVRAARLVARHDPAESEELVLRLLLDEHDTAVPAAMVASLLEARGEDAIPLILRALARADDDLGQHLLDGLLDGLQGRDLGAALVAAMLATTDREELAAALEAIGWLARDGEIPVSAEALARMRALEQDPEYALRSLAWHALEALETNPAGMPNRRAAMMDDAGDAAIDAALDAFYEQQRSTPDAVERLAALGDAETSGIARRWFSGDPQDPPPPDSVAKALLGPRADERTALILIALGQAPGGVRYDELREFLLRRLRGHWTNGAADVPAVVSAAIETSDRDHEEVLGGLMAIASLAPHGAFPLSPRARAYITLLSEDPRESHMRDLARTALDALGEAV